MLHGQARDTLAGRGVLRFPASSCWRKKELFAWLCLCFALSLCQNKMSMKKNLFALLCFLLSLACVSCGDNEIGIDVESSSVYSPSGHTLKRLVLEDDSSEFLYHISLKAGHVGVSSINLNGIDDAYTITYGHRVIANEDFRLRPTTRYTISNYSVPDAGFQSVGFTTSPSGDINRLEAAGNK